LNARLFRALNNSMQTSKEGEKRQNTLLESVRSSIAEEVRLAAQPLDPLLDESLGSLTESQRQALRTTRAALQRLSLALEKTTPQPPSP
jgi:ABC-type uncharacterized transport system ATPase component